MRDCKSFDVIIRSAFMKTGKYVFVVKDLNKQEVIKFIEGMDKIGQPKKNFMIIEHRFERGAKIDI